MIRKLFLLLALVSTPLAAQAPPAGTAPTPADGMFYSVAYIEVKPSARATAIQALKAYKDSLRINTANLRTELFEQADRAGHLLLIETWQSQAAFDAGTATPRKRLTD